MQSNYEKYMTGSTDLKNYDSARIVTKMVVGFVGS